MLRWLCVAIGSTCACFDVGRTCFFGYAQARLRRSHNLTSLTSTFPNSKVQENPPDRSTPCRRIGYSISNVFTNPVAKFVNVVDNELTITRREYISAVIRIGAIDDLLFKVSGSLIVSGLISCRETLPCLFLSSSRPRLYHPFSHLHLLPLSLLIGEKHLLAHNLCLVLAIGCKIVAV